MVKILASGEIVADDDPRASGGTSNRQGPATHRNRQGGIHQVNNQEPVQHMPDGSIFEGLNQRLLALGIPRWNVGAYVIEPIVSVGFLAAFLLMGLPGLLFAGILFFISHMGGGDAGQGYRGWLGGGGQGGQSGNSSGDSGPGGGRRPPRGNGGGQGGYRLGH